jgi:hypothetical protein
MVTSRSASWLTRCHASVVCRRAIETFTFTPSIARTWPSRTEPIGSSAQPLPMTEPVLLVAFGRSAT